MTGLPPGLTFDPNTYVISGTVSAGTSAQGPFEVNIHADDGIETADSTFELDVTGIQLAPPPPFLLNHVGDTVDFSVHATTTAGTSITYSATGLPPGITINPTTGEISGKPSHNGFAVSTYNTLITFNDGVTTQTTNFPWSVLDGAVDNITIPSPGTQTNNRG